MLDEAVQKDAEQLHSVEERIERAATNGRQATGVDAGDLDGTLRLEGRPRIAVIAENVRLTDGDVPRFTPAVRMHEKDAKLCDPRRRHHCPKLSNCLRARATTTELERAVCRA